MYILIVIGILLLAGIGIVCFAAYIIKAESFEVSAGIGKLISLSIKIISPAGKKQEMRPAGRKQGSGGQPES